MNDEILIETVRQYSELYDMSDSRYSNAVRKEALWNKIGEAMGIPGPECKCRWTSLRDQYRKILNKKTKSGQAATKTRTWKYENLMSFLIPYFRERETQTNISIGQQKENEDEEEEEADEEDGGVDTPPSISSFIPEPSTASSSARKRKRNNSSSSSSTELVRQLLHQGTQCPISLFFMSMAATVRTLSPARQRIAKDEVFKIVSQLEKEEAEI